MNNALAFQHGIGGRLGTVVPFSRTAALDQRPAISDFLALIQGAQSRVDPGDVGAIASQLMVQVRYLRAGETLFHEGSPADAIHFVRGGTFKVFRTAEDGYEQVLGFAMRSDVLGFEAYGAAVRPTAAMALENSSTFTIRADEIPRLVGDGSALALGLHCAFGKALRRCQQTVDLLAAVAAEVRLARFLLLMSGEMSARGQSAHRFHLRMSRRDIGSYLGVAHETISRGFTDLANWGIVSVRNREVGILDMERLRRLASSTRRQLEEQGSTPGRRTAAARARQPS